MAKTSGRSAAKQAQEKSDDGLEIISIGSLYKGPWDKKYWSSSRGKDRYPYPVGYQAVRAHYGTTYKMEIHEGVNGPKFLISADGNSSSGKTPDFAWEEFQKKVCLRTKIWHGKRLSSNMDGLELFGFKNPFVQRLLRELVADINGMAERSLESSNLCDGISKIEHGDCHRNFGTYPDLLPCLGKLHVTRKRSRCEINNKKLHGGARPRSLELTCIRASNVKDEKNLTQGTSMTHYGSEDEVNNHMGLSVSLQMMSTVRKSSNCSSSDNGLPLNPIDMSDNIKGEAVTLEKLTGYATNCKTTKITENLSTEEPLHRSPDAELQLSGLLVTSEDNKLMQSTSKGSQGCIDFDLCAPDTLDFMQDFAPSTLHQNADSERACGVTPGDLLNTAHEEVLTSNSNPSSEKSNFDSGGQDVAKSMMSVLLPQAVPLLRNVSLNKEFTISPSDRLPSGVTSQEEQNEIESSSDVPSSGKADIVVTENAYGAQEEKKHGLNTDPCSINPNSEHLKSIIPDTFESIQYEDPKTHPAISFSDIADAGRASFNKETCSLRSREQFTGVGLPNGPSMCHASGLDFKDRPEDGNVCIPDSVLDDMSPMDRVISERVSSACSNLEENHVHVDFNSMQKEPSTAQDLTEGISDAFTNVKTNGWLLNNVENLAEKTQDEVVGIPGNIETMTPSSSKLPNLVVYTRRKVRNAASFEGNCLHLESTQCHKFELIAPELHNDEGTLPPLENVLVNASDDKPCEPDDFAALHIETSQTYSDVMSKHSNLFELNNSKSSQNPDTVACENKCSGAKDAQFTTDPMLHRNTELKNNLGCDVKFLGCYLHPMPVSSLFLCTRENEIHVCVLCGLQMDQYRTLFTYKVAVTEPRFGFPSVMAYTSILLPDPKLSFMRETMVERCGVQLTPDGQYIVFLGSIKTPKCREGKLCCCCSICTSVCSEKNLLKIVQVEHGYVTVIAMLETFEIVHCILVCEPNRLVSVGESGRLQVLVMNSTWSEKIEDCVIPADDSISPGIVELKRVPKCAHLVVGRNSFGDFTLWDILKLHCISSFSASKDPVNEFFPISLFHWPTKDLEFKYVSEEDQADKLLEATNLWYSEHHKMCSFLTSEEGDVAMCLLVSTDPDLDSYDNHVSTSSHCEIHTTRSWRLALLVKNCLILGSPLDPRTTSFGFSGGHGIIGTSDGLVYMWELSRGSKLGTLHHFQDGTVTYVATDDSRGAFGVAGDGGELLIYLHLHELHRN